MVQLRHGRLPRLGAHAPRDDLGLGRGPELLHTAGFFVMLGVGTIFEKKWKEWTGKPVAGVFGSLWTTFWHLM